MNTLKSELDQAKAEIQHLKSQLSQQKHGITNEGSQQEGDCAKLIQQLERSNQELKQFAYIVSHDLKAPLRAINALVQWISEDYAEHFDEDGQEQMELLQNRVRRMDQLIEGVLHYSRIGRIREKLVSVNLNKLLTETIDFLAPPSTIQIQIDARLPVVQCEKVRIGQVFQNLLSNAIKFMDKSEGIIQISSIEEGDFFRFSIQDNGPGIAEKDHERIFQIFQTLHAGDSHNSTGIGLTLVKKIVELHGGIIRVHSQLGQGCCFEFTLPMDAIQHQPQE